MTTHRVRRALHALPSKKSRRNAGPLQSGTSNPRPGLRFATWRCNAQMLPRGTNLAAEHTMAYEHLPLLASLLGLFTLGPVACQPATAPHPSAAPGEAVADDASHGTPARGDDSPQATAAEAPDGEALAGVWVDPDALPAGARVRLGTKAFRRGDGLAVADDGRVATLDRDFNALIELRPSSEVRRTKIPEGARCQELRYVGARLLCLQQSPPARVRPPAA